VFFPSGTQEEWLLWLEMRIFFATFPNKRTKKIFFH
jgi:hypothetical protein